MKKIGYKTFPSFKYLNQTGSDVGCISFILSCCRKLFQNLIKCKLLAFAALGTISWGGVLYRPNRIKSICFKFKMLQ